MKIFSFISSIIAFALTLFFLITDFPDINTFNGFLYFSLFLILMVICITGILYNRPVIQRIHRRFRVANHSKH
jgi:hypothetical protein